MKRTFIILISLYSFMACKKEDGEKISNPLETIIASNINANYSHYQYFSFTLGDTVPFADSSTTNWDIAFKGTTVILNSGTSGTGNAGVIIYDTLFSEVLEAPSSGYAQDNTTAKAIPTGSGNGWYNYASFLITPIAGRVFVIRTAENKYVKMEFISYYKDAPTTPDAFTDVSRYYTIRYIYQPDGTRNLQ